MLKKRSAGILNTLARSFGAAPALINSLRTSRATCARARAWPEVPRLVVIPDKHGLRSWSTWPRSCEPLTSRAGRLHTEKAPRAVREDLPRAMAVQGGGVARSGGPGVAEACHSHPSLPGHPLAVRVSG